MPPELALELELKLSPLWLFSLGHPRLTGVEGGGTEIAPCRTAVQQARCPQEPGVRPASRWEIYTFFTRR